MWDKSVLPQKNEAAIVLNLAGSLAELGRPLHGESNYWISFEAHSEELGLTAEDIEDTLDSVRTRLEAILTSVED